MSCETVSHLIAIGLSVIPIVELSQIYWNFNRIARHLGKRRRLTTGLCHRRGWDYLIVQQCKRVSLTSQIYINILVRIALCSVLWKIRDFLAGFLLLFKLLLILVRVCVVFFSFSLPFRNARNLHTSSSAARRCIVWNIELFEYYCSHSCIASVVACSFCRSAPARSISFH